MIVTLQETAHQSYSWDQTLNQNDIRLDDIVDVALNLDIEALSSIADALGAKEARVLGIYSRRAASRAIRDGTRGPLQRGLGAIVLARWKEVDPRDLMVALAPLHFAACRISEDPETVFRSIALQVPAKMANVIATFGERRGVTLEAFGWKELATPAGTWIGPG
ncbi:MAG: hypothetical protein ACRDRT_10730 [Pseudonocardiaceae bacterium]